MNQAQRASGPLGPHWQPILVVTFEYKVIYKTLLSFLWKFPQCVVRCTRTNVMNLAASTERLSVTQANHQGGDAQIYYLTLASFIGLTDRVVMVSCGLVHAVLLTDDLEKVTPHSKEILLEYRPERMLLAPWSDPDHVLHCTGCNSLLLRVVHATREEGGTGGLP